MCGIVGYNGFRNARDVLFNGLKRLEYRGYDSAGIVVANGNDIRIAKCVGEVENLRGKIKKFFGTIGIAHTRWATHGGVSVKNAHPHYDCTKRVFVVHNGIIENYEKIKSQLEKKGHKFHSDTDTEVIPHFIEEHIDDIPGAMRKFMRTAKGTYAVVILVAGDDKLYAMKKSSPLALGIGKDEMIIGSDIYAFSNVTNRALFFSDGEYAVIGKNWYKIYKDGKEIRKRPHEFKWSFTVDKRKYKHFMLKEIHEEPQAIERLMKSLKTEQKDVFENFISEIKKAKKVYFVAAGTSYHASLVGAYYLNKLGIDARTMIASEFENYSTVGKDTLLIPVSQSGETMDVINVIKHLRDKVKKVVSIVNVPYSTIQRLSDFSLEIMAGQEIAVAATKSFINQVTLFTEVARSLGLNVIPERHLEAFISENEPKIKKLAKSLKGIKDIYIIGRGLGYPIAREIALKLKEISYIHAEGMMGGELKHGTIALIEKGTPVIALVSDELIKSNIKEVESRGAKVIEISPNGLIETKGNFVVEATTFGHLLSYYIALYRGLPIDKPRNLAKSVTVI